MNRPALARFVGGSWAAILLLATAGVPAARSQENNILVVVLDASGSMWGRIDGEMGEMKVVVAKEVVGELLGSVPTGVELGLVAYGHRRKGDCDDIESVATPGTAADAIADAVDRLTPRGRTPITAALQEAASLAATGGGTATVLLVSDGIETCGGDPCALAAALRQQNVELMVHTVGFGVDTLAVSQLQCIAERGGGHYFHADDGAALRQALFTVRDALAAGQAVPTPAAAPVPETTPVQTDRIRIAGSGTVVLEPAPWVEMPPHKWLLLDAESGEERGQSRETSQRAEAGEYQLVWHQAEHGGRPVPLTEVVTVTSRETVGVPIDTGVRLLTPEGWAAPYRWSLRRDGGNVIDAQFSRTLDPQVTPAGRFRLIWRQSEHGAGDVDLGPLVVEPGRLNEHVIDSGLVLRLPDWLGSGFRPYYYALRDADGAQQASWRDLGPQLAPAGDYTLVFRQSEHGHGEISWANVTLPDHGIVPVSIDSGVRFLPADDAERPYGVFFVDLDSGAEYVWHGGYSRDWDPVLLPPGRYRLDWWQKEHGSERTTLLQELEVAAGTLVEIEI